ncbi:MAG: HAMP domain-containing protein [Gemmatimonadetes bacterium]|nr:HAMP domain-containing protein [Gemmatimonadota bacterium]
MIRSFRAQLALRFAVTMTAAIVAVSGLSLLAIREALDRQIDASLLNVASIQAASLTDSPDGQMHFHEWELTPEEAASIRELNRYAQVWSQDGASLLRTRYIVADLPLDGFALRRAAGGELVWAQGRFQGGPIRSLYYPLGRLGASHEQHVLQVAAPLEARNRTLRSVALLLVGIVLLVSGGSFAGSWWLAERAVRPVSEIIDKAEAIGAGSLQERIAAYADTREYQRLVQVLNRMLERLQGAFEAQRRFTADASHELRSPLTALRGELELARRRDRSPAEYRRVIDSALEEVERLSALTENLLTLARSDAGVMEPRLRRTDLAERADHVLQRLRPKAGEKKIRLELLRQGDTSGRFDPDLLERLVWNLVDNAIKFTTPGGRVEVSVEGTDGAARIRVADTGPGLREQALPKIFDRFYRGDASRTPSSHTSGTGLGLAIVRAIAEAHRGRVSAGNRAEGGAVFTVELPRAPA